MMIRDLGWTVEFWFKAGYASDWANALDFNWTANGSTTAKAIKYPTGANWAYVGSVNVGSSQTITFRLLDATGTQGMGGPTTFNQWIERAQRPGPPGTPTLSNIWSTSITVTFVDGWNGGAAVDSKQIGYGTDPWTVQYYTDTWTTNNVGLLTPGTTWYFWTRAHNYQGWSDWSGRAQATTLRVPDAPTTPTLTNVSATSVAVSFTPNGNGGATILEYQVGWDISPSASSLQTMSASSPQLVTDLTPGTVYYFWVRARNAVGWGPWTNPSNIRTFAGARIKVGGTWKMAVPYVRVGGVWKRTEPWVRSAGTWKRTI